MTQGRITKEDLHSTLQDEIEGGVSSVNGQVGDVVIETVDEELGNIVEGHVSNTDVHVQPIDRVKWDGAYSDGQRAMNHVNNDNIHVTNTDKAKWNAAINRLAFKINIQSTNGINWTNRGGVLPTSYTEGLDLIVYPNRNSTDSLQTLNINNLGAREIVYHGNVNSDIRTFKTGQPVRLAFSTTLDKFVIISNIAVNNNPFMNEFNDNIVPSMAVFNVLKSNKADKLLGISRKFTSLGVPWLPIEPDGVSAYLNSFGECRLQGVIMATAATPSTGVTLFTLPEGMRPLQNHITVASRIFDGVDYSPSNYLLNINSSGAVIINTAEPRNGIIVTFNYVFRTV